MDAKIGTVTYQETQVLDNTIPSIVKAIKMATGNGKLTRGQLISKDSDSKHVPYKTNLNTAVGTGDGSNKDFSATAGSAPMQPGSVSITDGTSTITDNGFGVLIGDGSGTVNYETGDIAVSFGVAPGNTAAVVMTYANELVTVLTQNVDTETTDIGTAVKFGAVVKDSLHVATAELAAADIARLEAKNIYPL